jgi:hypothetical protein
VLMLLNSLMIFVFMAMNLMVKVTIIMRIALG